MSLNKKLILKKKNNTERPNLQFDKIVVLGLLCLKPWKSECVLLGLLFEHNSTK